MTYDPRWTTNRNLAYGDGSDGALASAGVTFANPHFYTTIGVNSGTLNVALFHAYGTGQMTLTATIGTTNGPSAVTSTAPGIMSPGTLPGQQPGTNGGTGSGRTGFSSLGLTGLQGGGGKTAGGQFANGSAVTNALTGNKSILSLISGQLGVQNTTLIPDAMFGTTVPGSGPGIGDGDGVNNGGSAGSCGGAIWFAVASVNLNGGTVSATGGNGGNGTAGNTGGGGAGGGGGAWMCADFYLPTAAITTSLSVGTAGTGFGAGGGGNTGVAGTLLQVLNS